MRKNKVWKSCAICRVLARKLYNGMCYNCFMKNTEKITRFSGELKEPTTNFFSISLAFTPEQNQIIKEIINKKYGNGKEGKLQKYVYNLIIEDMIKYLLRNYKEKKG